MNSLESTLKDLFVRIGEDPERDGLNKTSDRVLKMYESFLTGYQEDPLSLLGQRLELHTPTQECIRIDRIPFCALCEHHLVPFFGEASVSFIPESHTLGLSHFFNFFEKASRRLALQENLCGELARIIFQKLEPKALYVEMSALHTCLALSHQNAKHTQLVTECFLGDATYKPQLMNYGA